MADGENENDLEEALQPREMLRAMSVEELRVAGIPVGDAKRLQLTLYGNNPVSPSAIDTLGKPMQRPLAMPQPDSLYVWCTCWKRLFIAPNGITVCECGNRLDPIEILAYNRRVWDDENPVTNACWTGVATKSGTCCWQASCYTMGSFCAASVLALSATSGYYGPFVCYYAFCSFITSFWLPPTLSLLASGLTWFSCSCAECNCCHDRTGRVMNRFITTEQSPFRFVDNGNDESCCFEANEQCCVASHSCERCMLDCYNDCRCSGCGTPYNEDGTVRKELIYVATSSRNDHRVV